MNPVRSMLGLKGPVAKAPALTAPAIELADGPPTDPAALYHLGARSCVQAQLAELYPFLGRGYSRHVYDGGDVVYKVGMHHAQVHEVAAYELPETHGGVPVAPCRMVWHPSGLSIVIMETVRPATVQDTLPEWAKRIDATQVGFRRSGECVVFDAGEALLDIPRSVAVERRTLPSIFA